MSCVYICLSSVISRNVQKPMCLFCTFLKNSLMLNVMKTLHGRALNVNQECTSKASKSIKIRFKIGLENVFVLKSLSKSSQNRFWSEFGPILHPKWPGFCCRNRSWNRSGHPTWIQRPSQAIFEPTKLIFKQFWIVLASIWDRFWTD